MIIRKCREEKSTRRLTSQRAPIAEREHEGHAEDGLGAAPSKRLGSFALDVQKQIVEKADFIDGDGSAHYSAGVSGDLYSMRSVS